MGAAVSVLLALIARIDFLSIIITSNEIILRNFFRLQIFLGFFGFSINIQLLAVSTIFFHRMCGLVDFPEIHTVSRYFPDFPGFSAVLTISIHMI